MPDIKEPPTAERALPPLKDREFMLFMFLYDIKQHDPKYVAEAWIPYLKPDGITKLEAHKNIWKDVQAVMSSYMDEQKFKGAPMPNSDNLAIVEVLLIAFRIYCEGCEGVPSAEDIQRMLDDKPLYKRLSERKKIAMHFCGYASLQSWKLERL